MKQVLFLLLCALSATACERKDASNSNVSIELSQIADNMEAQANEVEALVTNNVGHPVKSTSDSGMETATFPSELDAFGAYSIVSTAGHDCNRVVSLDRSKSDPIATCEDGERYRLVRVLKPVRQDLAMKCSAMVEAGIKDGC